MRRMPEYPGLEAPLSETRDAKRDILLRRRVIPTGSRTCIMGFLNVTPDSFSDGGRFLDPSRAVERAMEMVVEGADVIDIGGESSRPGSKHVSAEEELRRVMPVIQSLAGKTSVPLSIDTWKSEVARGALAGGAQIVNDITALRGDTEMARVIAEHGAGVVLMHMKGDPGTMQDDPFYDDLLGEIISYLGESISIAESAGIDSARIMVDPGIGFGKTAEHNLRIIKELRKLKDLGKPLLVGTSRKSFIGEVTGREVDERDFGTAASVAVAIQNGADMVRVHDVGKMRDATRVVDTITGV